METKLKYLADLSKGSMVSATALIKMDDKGKVSIKILGYEDNIVATPTKRDFSKIPFIEEIPYKVIGEDVKNDV